MSNKTKISIIVPVYNEEDAIGEVLDTLKKVIKRTKYKHEIIVVDDGSTDRTSEIVKRKKMKLIQHLYNKGYGSSLKSGIKNSNGNIIIIIDGDGTYPIEDIPRLLEYSDEYDMIVGARNNMDISLLRRPAKFILSKLANYLTGIKIPDLNSGLRLFKKETAVRFFDILPSGFSFTTTLTLAYFSNDFSIKYIPINYKKRRGKSKIKPFKDTLNFISLIVKTILYFNPLKVFLPASFLLFLGAVGLFLYSWLILKKMMDVSVTIITLTAVQIAFFGFFADLIMKKRG